MSQTKSFGIHWFRRDLRVAGNSALKRQFLEHEGRVVGVFCVDPGIAKRSDFSATRFQFFLESLKALKDELRQGGGDLLVVEGKPKEALPQLFKKLKSWNFVFSWNRDYEPYAVQRDRQIAKLLTDLDVEYFHERDHLLIEPTELERAPGQGYQIFTPFQRKWLEISATPEVQKRLREQKSSLTYLRKLKSGEAPKLFSLRWKPLLSSEVKDVLESSLAKKSKIAGLQLPEAGSLAAFRTAENFKKQIEGYGAKRDLPSLAATSQLSPYLKVGAITVPQLMGLFHLERFQKKTSGKEIYFSELIWREFYFHILSRQPSVEKEAFQKKYLNLDWENDRSLFQAWKDGMTGFPIVDAGMRQLQQTGWMHNRVRMIVASFLTKDLLIDWRWGEKHFMQSLLDGDQAANNGGWQWAASTGCDPQPYFRIFNPWLQSKKFDPEGEYICRFVPELKELPSKALHQPILGHPNYPEPVVDHAAQKKRALALYKSC